MRHTRGMTVRTPALALASSVSRSWDAGNIVCATHIRQDNNPVAMKPTRNGPTRVDNNDAFADGLAVKVRPKTKKPPMYRVLLLNDDFTPMEFVVYVLERVFSRSRQEATDIMLSVHQKGVGTAGVYTYEIAETKVDQVMLLARQHEHPLQCTMEREN